MNQRLRALISVSDKQGLAEFAKELAALDVEILSTGGTASTLREAGIKVIDVAEYTQSPEIMGGRVKTLHPRVHGGILLRDRASDRDELSSIGGKPIDIVVVNLYPFGATVARAAPHEEVIENIDIGGPSMLRSAAKNYGRVTVVVDPADYPALVFALKSEGGLSVMERERLAGKAFLHTARYDKAIAAYFADKATQESAGSRSPGLGDALQIHLKKAYDLRYGENPHQAAAFFVAPDAPAGSLARARSVGQGAKELSFNNLVDAEAALDAVREFDQPAAVVVKHTNPCGVAEADSLSSAYERARHADALSAFGGIVALNRTVDAETASLLVQTFLECVIAPAFSDEALPILRTKAQLRLLATDGWLTAQHRAMCAKQVGGGFVYQERDASAGGEVKGAKVVTERAPSSEELRALDFAWRVCKHVKSNAIVLAKATPGLRTVGVGAGQMSRVVSVQLAVEKAGREAQDSVLASDAFFPFPDGVLRAAEAGVSAIAQPGGSKKDNEVIKAADAAGMAMVMTGVRHFRH
ncbi:MAG: bifunctional phosphoribosylaminoimidazolecarboxamide formyltransferase/IMP cyclohydrolase [Myxococcales bacterium]|nr:bifunctional phosphoribosylaminoimidazolecarboxamide formyltransferase/IMP cyclohydrolase [Myxococcales bacterium]MCB9709399.1 bifunctional phosphoribosylaminoimidazolecarboxamide formyltransferase/IMP cyclohydrolase [Myxococcales bacterium]